MDVNLNSVYNCCKAVGRQMLKQKYIPLQRYGHLSEIGSLLCYMASDVASFFTSEFVTVDRAVMNHLFKEETI